MIILNNLIEYDLLTFNLLNFFFNKVTNFIFYFFNIISLNFFTYIIYLNLYDLILLFILTFSIWNIAKTNLFKNKLIYYFLLLITMCSWGFYFSFDGFILFLLSTELLIIILFLLISLSSNFFNKFVNSSILSFSYLFFIIFCLYLLINITSYSGFSYLYKNSYTYIFDIVSSDLFIYFYTFFISFPIFIIFFTLILSFFTIFFVIFYFQLKKFQFTKNYTSKSYELFRKQDMLRQAKFKTTITLFKKL